MRRAFTSAAVRGAVVRRIVKRPSPASQIPRTGTQASAQPRVEPKLNPQAAGSLNDAREPKLASEPRVEPEPHIRSVPELPRKSDSDGEVAIDESMVNTLTELEAAESPETLGDDWTTSFQGLGSAPFPREAIDILMAPINPKDVEVTPDGMIYLPEIKYRRILNRAFGPGGWGIAPRTKTMVTKRKVTREYGLVCLGRLVSVSRGEMDFFSAEGVTTAMEGCKSNALMRCCKDLGIASELWDPAFIRQFKAEHLESKYFEKRKRFAWKRKDRQWEYPYV